jgi:CheY-like chemotaxis protein
MKKKYMFPVKILVVDDEEDIREILKLLLSSLCEKVLVATSGKDAIKILEQDQVDLIISDMKMPEIDGFKLLEHVIRESGQHKPQFIFISGGVDLDARQEKTINEHTQGIISKPFSMDELISKLALIFPD